MTVFVNWKKIKNRIGKKIRAIPIYAKLLTGKKEFNSIGIVSFRWIK